ncbi:hypothetical protein COHA_001215 [Chlorella ohadii]|uniref:Alpha-1,3-glucosyltransferase n=1 Tax=Chlorella ohadii TaxID=2649997 RepID=A0AAD5DW80_9CHLO|nr:hypothetical protein COHA_001215 [Chlorella ohadii]
MNTPPRFGDYEAQRHWMEVAVNLPATEWYRNSSANDLSYWGLDYPPLSGYQSWLCGRYVGAFEPEAVQLVASRGYESPSSKRLLRQTVLASDAAVFLPAALAAAAVFGGGGSQGLLVLVALLFSPAAVLIDHGHFQYNCIGLGLAAGGAAAAAAGRGVLASLLFSLSLNHKQMGLYYAPAFFAFLLGRCLQQPTLGGKVGGVLRLGAAVAATFAVVWAPWLAAPGGALGVLRRIFPTQRGLYEDYVANWWCASSRLVKWARLLPQPSLVKLCGATTLAALAPAGVLAAARPTPRALLLCLANSAMAFFLFSYQVHEKSILLPLLPLAMLLGGEQPGLLCWANAVAVFSMLPLLKKDGLALATAGATAACHAAIQLAAGMVGSKQGSSNGSGKRSAAAGSLGALPPAWLAAGWRLSLAGCAAILAASAVAPPPPKLPFLYDALTVTWAFLHFAALFAYTNWLQWLEFRSAAPGRRAAKRKQA